MASACPQQPLPLPRGPTAAGGAVRRSCFDAQQAAEKAIKAVLVLNGKRFPKTHDVAELLDLVAATGVAVPSEVLLAKRLTPYAVAGRYPGVSEDASEEDYREALATAQDVVGWVEELVAVRKAR